MGKQIPREKLDKYFEMEKEIEDSPRAGMWKGEEIGRTYKCKLCDWSISRSKTAYVASGESFPDITCKEERKEHLIWQHLINLSDIFDKLNEQLEDK